MENKVSVIIPARNEIYLEKTVRNILENARGDIEVIVVLDGWVPDPPIDFKDERVKVFHLETALGHRAATNHGARHALGKYIMKIDAHCAVGEGFDVILQQDCEYDWTVIPRMYNLDVETWKPRYFDDFRKAVRQRKVHDYLYIYINERDELRTQYYPSHINKVMHHDRANILIDETMSCMGPCFFMHAGRFWELGGCDEKHEGGWGQQAIEVACKAWLSGGKLMVNKKTWFAHWFRGGQGWPYPISGNQISRARAYSKDLWLNDKWPLAKRKFMWLVEKFDPPGWEKKVNAKVEKVKEDKLSIEEEEMRLGKSRGSYMPVLTKLVAQTTGSILELGMGFCSTPFLHWACYPQKRRLVSCENNPEYLRFAESWKDDFHEVRYVSDWDTVDLSEPWSIAFVDHSPGPRRAEEMKRLVHADYVIVHDTENNNNHRYKISTVHHLFKYRWKYTKAYPYTSIFSNKHDLSEFKDL